VTPGKNGPKGTEAKSIPASLAMANQGHSSKQVYS
jgi:hypothetical protein